MFGLLAMFAGCVKNERRILLRGQNGLRDMDGKLHLTILSHMWEEETKENIIKLVKLPKLPGNLFS